MDIYLQTVNGDGYLVQAVVVYMWSTRYGLYSNSTVPNEGSGKENDGPMNDLIEVSRIRVVERVILLTFDR